MSMVGGGSRYSPARTGARSTGAQLVEAGGLARASRASTRWVVVGVEDVVDVVVVAGCAEPLEAAGEFVDRAAAAREGLDSGGVVRCGGRDGAGGEELVDVGGAADLVDLAGVDEVGDDGLGFGGLVGRPGGGAGCARSSRGLASRSRGGEEPGAVGDLGGVEERGAEDVLLGGVVVRDGADRWAKVLGCTVEGWLGGSTGPGGRLSMFVTPLCPLVHRSRDRAGGGGGWCVRAAAGAQVRLGHEREAVVSVLRASGPR
jgi:hypothetical protein